MLDVRLITRIIFVFACFTCVISEGYYLIVAPKVLRPTLNYHVSVSVHNVTRPVGMTLTIGGLTDSGSPIMMSQQALLESDKSQVVNFQVGDWGTGKYTMRVVGTGGLQFSNETELYYEHKSYLVFVQTDKAIYKPGQPVKIRVIVVGPSLKPASTGNLDMFIMDGQGNRIKQWKRMFLTRGVFSTEMPLSEEPVLGDWNITVTILDQIYTKSFTVAEYVLPSFEVSVHVPPYATFNSSDMVATIEAKYTYGKPVKGKVVVMVTPLVRSPQIRTYYTDPLRKIAEIDGKVEIPFNLQHDLNLKDDYHRMIRFEAIVTESETERRENSTAVMGMFKYPEKIELIKMSETFKPGLKFSAFLKIAFQDDIPVDDDANPLVLKYGYSHDESLYERREFRIPRNGTIPFDIFPPLADNIHQLVIIAQYKDVQQPFVPIRRAESPSNTYLQAVLLTEKPRVGEEVIIQVNSTVPLKTFNVVVMGRGDIVFSDSVIANDKRTIAVKFAPTNPMAPRIRFIVYYTTPQGEVVADGLSFEVEGVFQNYVNIDSSRSETQPGQTVNLQITTNRNSLVGLLAVDQSVLLLKTGNDVTQVDILKQLDKFDPGKQPYSDEDLFYSAVWFPGSSTAAEVFKNSGVIALSNSLIYEDFAFFETRGGELRPGFEKGRPVGDYFIPKESEIGFRDPLDGTIIPTVRRHFPETWIWSEVTAGGDGKAVITREAPDTITSWVITAFSLDSVTGLAVTNSPSRVTVFRPFFISLNLPYAVIRGEAISVQVVVFNYMKRPVSATVTLENTNQFDFVSIEDEANEVQATSLKSKKVIVESGDPTSVYFMIVPKELGYIDIKVTARADIAGDAMLKKLLVKPQGVPQYFNKAFLVDLRMPSLFNANATVEIPKHAVNGSARIQVSAIADVMGPTINNFDKLLQMPFGCGEQNMILFVPNIVALEYLTSSDQLTDSLQVKAITNMEKGYQRELTYKREDGSFSAFGNQDDSGSTWLTAFVCKSFAMAKPYITIDEQVINQSLTWLSEQQLENGSFPEVGTVSNKEIQGGAGKGTALTAFVLIAFLENKGTTQFTPFMIKALHLLEQEVENLHQVYSLAITTYALHLANSPSKDVAFRRLQGTATTQGDLKFWRRVSDVDTPATLKQMKPVDVETTAYALLTYVLRRDLSGAMQIMKWLVTQRNEEGGFLSTQDTVVAVQALAKLAMNIVDPKVSINVAFSYNDQKKTFNLNRNNAMILQKEQLPNDVKLVNISATGNGFALVQISYSYNIFVSKEFPAFQVNPFVDRSSTKNRMQLSACVAYGEKGGVSNMAVMEVTLPSGFIVDRNSLPALHGVDRVKRVDIKDQDTGVTIYFDKLDNNLVCPTIKAHRVFRVAKQKQTAVYVYDYYDQAQGARYFFQAPQVSLCDICDGEECSSRKCQEEAEEKQQAAIQEEDSVASGTPTSVILIILAFFISMFIH